MPIHPGKDEKQEDWMARCVPEMMGESGGTKRPQEQAVAACMQMWQDANQTGGKAEDGGRGAGEQRQDFGDDLDPPDPDDDESRDDYIDR